MLPARNGLSRVVADILADKDHYTINMCMVHF